MNFKSQTDAHEKEDQTAATYAFFKDCPWNDWGELKRSVYDMDGKAMACVLCEERAKTDALRSYAVLLVRDAECLCAVTKLSLEEGLRVWALFSQNRVSLFHVRDVLEDLAADGLRQRLRECEVNA